MVGIENLQSVIFPLTLQNEYGLLSSGVSYMVIKQVCVYFLSLWVKAMLLYMKM